METKCSKCPDAFVLWWTCFGDKSHTMAIIWVTSVDTSISIYVCNKFLIISKTDIIYQYNILIQYIIYKYNKVWRNLKIPPQESSEWLILFFIPWKHNLFLGSSLGNCWITETAKLPKFIIFSLEKVFPSFVIIFLSKKYV